MLSNKHPNNVLVCGDIIVDQYINCSLNKISREAPIPIYNVKSNKYILGGAGNVVANLVSLGQKVSFVGTSGNDESGKWLSKELKKLQVKSLFFKNTDNLTTTKTRYVVNNHQVSRVDMINQQKVHTDIFKFKTFLTQLKPDKIIISDYGQNFVTDEVCKLLITYSNQNNIPLLIDPRGNDWSRYKNAWCVTPNLEELSEAVGYKVENSNNEVKKAVNKLAKTYSIKNIIVTRSENGISAFGPKEEYHAAIDPIEVIDVVGAGDVVLATLAYFAEFNKSWKVAVDAANAMARICVRHFGVYVISLAELQRYQNGLQHSKLFDIDSAKKLVTKWKKEGKTIVFTNGCFDLVHFGHIYYLYKAKELGQKLIVGLNSDKSVTTIKGPTRPVSNEKSRIAVLSALEMIDGVVIFSEPTPENLIKELAPDILVKGADWKGKKLPGERYAKKVEYISYQENYSTTNLVKKIK